MPTLSLRKALTPHRHWAVIGVRNTTGSAKVNGILTPTGEWTTVKVHNPGSEPVSVTYDVRSEAGELLESFTVTVGAHATVPLIDWVSKLDSGTMMLRCASPTLVTARTTGGAAVDVPVFALPAT